MANMSKTYAAYAAHIYGNTSQDLSDTDDYRRCIAAMDNASVDWIERVRRVKTAMQEYMATSNNWTAKLDRLAVIESFNADAKVLLATAPAVDDGGDGGQQAAVPLTTSDCDWPGVDDSLRIIADKTFGLFVAYIQAATGKHLLL